MPGGLSFLKTFFFLPKSNTKKRYHTKVQMVYDVNPKYTEHPSPSRDLVLKLIQSCGKHLRSGGTITALHVSWYLF